VSGWHPRYSSGACDATQWSNLTFRCLIKCTIVSSFIWCGAWQHMVVGLSPTVIFSFFSLLVSPLLGKMHDCPFFFNFNPHSFMFFFFIPLIKVLFFFQFSLSIIISHMFCFFIFVNILLIFKFFFPWPFC
jgi:hypothetical protein